MKKIFAISMLATLTGCMSLSDNPAPVEKVNQPVNAQKMKPIDTVAQVEASVVSEPLYLSSDSVAISETQLPVNDSEARAVPTEAATNSTETVEAAQVDDQTSAAAQDPVVAEVADQTHPDQINNDQERMVEIVGEDHQVSSDRVEQTTEAHSAEVAAAAVATDQATDNTSTHSEPAVEAQQENHTTEHEAPVADEQAIEATQPEQTTVEGGETTATEETPVGEKTTSIQGYSIQLLALRNASEFLPYLNQLPSDQPAWLNDKTINGSSVYTLLYGHYSDYDAAKAALAGMPKKITQTGAFVRNLADIETTQFPKLERIR
ncbi:SPOR domain-containing protein [Photobacterium leiognathi]|uniref:SPOR domain-containing protein n=1 Tax=Photobacterium leiognathi TaxID=553611 RepID=UPI00020886A5|nr:SPOR domain-containing protein [Photobacterium leiognathi]PSW55554.1 SPOR domain-containing protein [Photobacterium leiognathi subsp. mandapamensis]GAA06475.1 sporulation related domain protein [Photobacterium leiognathi subsp. mandapamensis svers.1.1.]